MLNGIDLFYKIELPKVFVLTHTVGIVLSNTVYGNYFVIFQNSTVGRIGDDRPVIGEGVVMFPNTCVSGRCQIGSRTILSQGTRLINSDSPGNVIIFQNGNRDYTFREGTSKVYEWIFRDMDI
jgi:serine O-acetyltransferase